MRVYLTYAQTACQTKAPSAPQLSTSRVAHAGLYLRGQNSNLAAAAPVSVPGYTAFQAQDYQATDFNCTGSLKAGYCNLPGDPEVRHLCKVPTRQCQAESQALILTRHMQNMAGKHCDVMQLCTRQTAFMHWARTWCLVSSPNCIGSIEGRTCQERLV